MNVNHVTKPLSMRTPDTQYADRLRYILANGEWRKETAQGVGALTCLGTVPQMIFNHSNGIPLITERAMTFWKQPLREKIGFIHGARTVDELEEKWGCKLWNDYRGHGTELGLEPNDLGPGSYGPAFHDFPKPDGGTLNQFQQLIEQIRDYPSVRTHLITPWIPFYTACGPNRKVIIAPCHGWLHFGLINDRLHMEMHQRSADMPIGVPSNMIQYAALHLMICQVTGYLPGNFIHSFWDAHIYENQMETILELLDRPARPFPKLRLDPSVKNLFDFRIEHFTLEEYDPHPGMKVPYSP